VSRQEAAPADKTAALKGTLSRLGHLAVEHKLTVIGCVCVLVFLWLLSEVCDGELTRIDTIAYSFFVETLRADWLTPIMEGFSSLASPIVLLAMLVVVAAFAPGRRPGVCATLNLALVIVLNQVLKVIVQRPRPDGFRLVAESGYSFPSGHSMVAMAFFGLLAWMVWKYEKDRVMKWLWCICLGLIVIMVGVSRIYLGVHYATDVLGGFCVSLAWLALYTQVVCPLLLPERWGDERPAVGPAGDDEAEDERDAGKDED
jgi:undecaprenyl-diphosphatase